jgi:hypothetical protein
MTTQSQPRFISISAELARPADDDRHRLAQRWQAALHKLCLVRATENETTYEIEWARIFDREQIMADIQQRFKLLAFAALDVLDVQHDYTSMVCDMEGIAYDRDRAAEFSEMLVAMRIHVVNDLSN